MRGKQWPSLVIFLIPLLESSFTASFLEDTYSEILLFFVHHLKEDITLGGLVVNSFGLGSVISRGQVYLIQQFLPTFLKS